MNQFAGRREPRYGSGTVPGPKFPIVEVFGYPWDSTDKSAKDAARRHWCPFTDVACEKFRQYGYGNCSVKYAAADDEGQAMTYAVCDHRLDGPPLKYVIDDHFRDLSTTLVPEVVLTSPRTSFDFVAFETDNIENVIAIETQAIDIRGGGVGPAFRAWQDGQPEKWREYFTKEAKEKGRKDNVAYGVNMANIYKRLGLQAAVKGTYLKGIDVPFYVLMQDRPFQYLRRRINFKAVEADWDITFITFDYAGDVDANGRLTFSHQHTVRTTVDEYVTAMSGRCRNGEGDSTGLSKASQTQGWFGLGPGGGRMR